MSNCFIFLVANLKVEVAGYGFRIGILEVRLYIFERIVMVATCVVSKVSVMVLPSLKPGLSSPSPPISGRPVGKTWTVTTCFLFVDYGIEQNQKFFLSI